MSEIRVLMVVPNLRVSNGVASFAMNYYRKLDHDLIHMDFVIISDKGSPYYEEIKSNGNKIFVLPSITRNPLSHVEYCEQMIKDGHYDIIHDCVPLKSLLIMTSAKKYRVPVRILHSHSAKLGETNGKEKLSKMFIPFLRRTATDYFACSGEAAEALFPGKKYTFIPNVIDSKKFQYDANKRKRIRREMNAVNKVIVATVGRPSYQKNPIFALNVMSEVIRQNPNVEYWWIGSGAMDDDLRHGVSERHIEDNVRLLGSRDDIVDLYQTIDIFFLPSRFEGLPVTGIEAQAMGLPSVISNTITKEMAYTDLVEYVPLDAPIETWIEAIEKQINRIPERRSYTKELENSVFSIENAGYRLESLYEEKLKQARK